MASVSDQNRLRQPITSPICACTPRKLSTPVTRAALNKSPAMKSSFTASRVQPCMVKPLKKPERG